MRSALPLCLVALVVVVVVDARFRDTRELLRRASEVAGAPLSPECEAAGQSCAEPFVTALRTLTDATSEDDAVKIICDATDDLESCLASSLTEDCLNDDVQAQLDELHADFVKYCLYV